MNAKQQQAWVKSEVLTDEMQAKLFEAVRQAICILRPVHEELEAKLKATVDSVEGGQYVTEPGVALYGAVADHMLREGWHACDDKFQRQMVNSLATGDGLY